MSKLNRDILYLIFKELRNDKKTFYSCLSVNKTWCEIIIPILWNNPWKYLNDDNNTNEKILLDKIISHLSDESRDNIKKLGIELTTNLYKKPLFNYISFCRHLNLNAIKRIIINSGKKIILKEIIYLFINENTKFTHLYIPQQFNHQIHLIPGAEICFSEIEFLSCNTSINDNVLIGLIKMCKPIKELELYININNNNYKISELIETPKKLFNVRLLNNYALYLNHDESFCKIIENSLIKHSNTIKYFKITKQPITTILSYFINLKSLELNGNYHKLAWDCLENVSLPFLQILKTIYVSTKPLTSLIENTNGYLNEIIINDIPHDDIDNKRIIQIIYKKCPKLKYLKLEFKNSNILELNNLLINCHYLNGLFFINSKFDWNNLFEILIKSSPINLYKFKFDTIYDNIEKDSLKYFFNNWKDKHPLLLQFNQKNLEQYSDLIEKYKEEGIIKKFDYNLCNEDFKWI
ncbi:hypothetical protein C1646_767517 [Rhizophagus diaphanus]|nr:hypothetical protein C1646_767517 [Rhizophagus diaphanus] [Rhizophagus sp. MUCL 43196]